MKNSGKRRRNSVARPEPAPTSGSPIFRLRQPRHSMAQLFAADELTEYKRPEPRANEGAPWLPYEPPVDFIHSI